MRCKLASTEYTRSFRKYPTLPEADFKCTPDSNGQNEKTDKTSKLRGWFQVDLHVEWHFPAYKFDMK